MMDRAARRDRNDVVRRGLAGRIGLPLVLVSLLFTIELGLVSKVPCLMVPDWQDGRQYRMYCYTDIVPLYRAEGLSAGKIPYLDVRNEYPVGTGLFMWIASIPANGVGGFFATNALLLAALSVLTAFLLFREVGSRAFYFTLAPTLLLCAFLNWDLLPVALATAGTVAYLRGRDEASGVLLGLGAAAKMFPALLVVPFVLGRLREGRSDRGLRLAAWASGTWVVLNLPFALLAVDRWSLFFRFNAARPADWDSLWFIGCHRLTGQLSCGHTPVINAGSALLFVVVSVGIWRLRSAVSPDFARWTFGFPLLVAFLLTNKVYSPQYGLWLLPWFALVLPDLRLFALFEAADVAVFLTRFSWLGRSSGYGGLPIGFFEVAVLVRSAILVACLVAWVRRREPASVVAAPRPAAVSNVPTPA